MFDNKYYINNRKSEISTIWLMFLIIFLLIFLNIFLNYNYKKYDKYIGYIKNDNGFKVITYILENEINSLKDYSLFVNNKKYKFKIDKISKEYYIIDAKKYYEVEIDTKLQNNMLIENNIIELVFEKSTTTLYKELKKGIIAWIN